MCRTQPITIYITIYSTSYVYLLRYSYMINNNNNNETKVKVQFVPVEHSFKARCLFHLGIYVRLFYGGLLNGLFTDFTWVSTRPFSTREYEFTLNDLFFVVSISLASIVDLMVSRIGPNWSTTSIRDTITSTDRP